MSSNLWDLDPDAPENCVTSEELDDVENCLHDSESIPFEWQDELDG